MPKRTDRKVTVMICRVGKPDLVTEVIDNLKTYQDIVGGHIEGYSLPMNRQLYLYCNGDGKFLCPPNQVVGSLGMIHGDFVIVRCGKNGDAISLTKKDIALLIKASSK